MPKSKINLGEMVISRRGRVTEYKKGHTYLTHVEWEDGHNEIEVHRCIPELIWHSCDKKDMEEAFVMLATSQNEPATPTLQAPQARLEELNAKT